MTDKTDRELLELAAKAAGIKAKWKEYTNAPPTMVGMYDAPVCGVDGFIWNPLEDDGDALRLAVSLELLLRLRHSENAILVYGGPYGVVDEGVHGDPCAATRRAIVRAAAAIGDSMP